jgi:outer membrane protein
MLNKVLAITAATLAAAPAPAQSDGPLTLDDLLRSARENNGAVRAARLQYLASKADARAAASAFYPVLTPRFRRESGRIETLAGRSRGGRTIDQTDAGIGLDWLVLDNGSRSATVGRARLARDTAELTALDTYRQVLFNVHQSYYSALRAVELLRVQSASLERAKRLEDAARLRAELGAGAPKDVLQAEADRLNAEVAVLAARNQVATSLATLKALSGWPTDTMPDLALQELPTPGRPSVSLQEAVAEGLANRPSLLAQRKRLEAAQLAVRLARLAGGVTFTASAQVDKSFSESVFERTVLVLQASIPVFDGWRSLENVRSAELAQEAQSATVAQAERDARAAIESAYTEFSQNFDRLRAADLALAAAKKNYEAAAGSFQEGAGTILDQITAEVSLRTAESNRIGAYYDVLLSEVQLRLAMGRALPGEDE